MKVYSVIMIWGLIMGKFLARCIDQITHEERMTSKKHLRHDLRIELFTAICFAIIYFYNGLSMKTLIGCTFVVFAIVLTMIDWHEMILPTSVIGWGIIIGFIERIVQARMAGNWILLVDALMGAIVGYLFFMGVFYGSQWFLKKEGMGYGDVRLMGFIGLYTGLQTLFLALLIGSILASIYGIILLNLHKKSEAYPLGPFLNTGGIIVFLWGHEILNNSVRFLNDL